MEVFNYFCAIVSLIASLTTIVTCIPLFSAAINHIRNRISNKTLTANVVFDTPFYDKIFKSYLIKVDIYIKNKTANTIFICNPMIITETEDKKESKLPIYDRVFACYGAKEPVLYKKINPKESTVLKCISFVDYNYILPKDVYLTFSVNEKPMTYKINT